MKKVLLVLVFMFIPVVCLGCNTEGLIMGGAESRVVFEEKKAKEAKYEVSITVVYNAVTIEEANAITKDALVRHKTACKNEVKLKKTPDLSVSSSYITFDNIYAN